MLIESGDEIVQRLKDKCQSAKGNVFTTADLAGVMEKDQVTPALHVVLFSFAPSDEASGDAVWDEIYLVVAVEKNVSKANRVGAQLSSAAPLVRDAVAALSGWKPKSSSKALQPIAGPRAKFSETHVYLPLAFVAKPITEGSEDGL